MERQPIHVKDGGLADVLVYVKSPVSGTYAAPADPVTLDQKGCDYSPHMVTMQAGQGLKIRNSDDTLHNIHPRPTANEEFNFGQAKQGMEKTRVFDKAEVMIPVGCDVHPWMRAYISVFTNPFYTVTKEDGTFEIKGLPAGEYEIEAFHGKLKSQTQKVTVKSGEATALNFAYKG
jgi:plastocyanin